MKALLPVFCRPVGYLVLLIALFILPVLYIQGMVTDHNLLFYKECTKLLMMSGCLLIIFALSKNESRETEQIRNAAVRNAVFLTFLFVFGGMLWRVIQRDIMLWNLILRSRQHKPPFNYCRYPIVLMLLV